MKLPRKRQASLCGFTAAILLAVLTATISGQEDNRLMHECQGVEIELVEEHALSFDECLKAYNATSFKDIKPSNVPCVGKCIMEKTGLVDGLGKPHKENIFKMITDILPPAVHDDLQRKFEVCLEEDGDALDPEDEGCVSYLPLIMCFHLSFLEECMPS